MKHREKHKFGYDGISRVPGNIRGVYAFWCRTRRKFIYVGKADKQTIRERLRQHWRESHNDTLNLWLRAFGEHLDICWLRVPERKISKVERILIKMWLPETNDHHTRS